MFVKLTQRIDHCATEVLLWLAGEEMYIAMDKGAISKTHVLLLPIDHTSSTLELRPAQYAELDRFLDALRDYYKSQVTLPLGWS